MGEHEYSGDFYAYIDAGSRRSARAVAGLLLPEIKIGSLLDVGAGHGAWAAEWLAAGVGDALAVDGDYVRADQLAVPAKYFRAHDLAMPLDLGRRFDLVQSLEVAEHLPRARADLFVDNLVAHGDLILFSAAVPHQGGEHHVNEQPPQYWREKFAARGYQPFDFLRPRLAGRVPADQPLEIGGDLAWTVRRAAVRLIPPALVKPIAMAKASLEARLRK